jgi:hypothetical protein
VGPTTLHACRSALIAAPANADLKTFGHLKYCVMPLEIQADGGDMVDETGSGSQSVAAQAMMAPYPRWRATC